MSRCGKIMNTCTPSNLTSFYSLKCWTFPFPNVVPSPSQMLYLPKFVPTLTRGRILLERHHDVARSWHHLKAPMLWCGQINTSKRSLKAWRAYFSRAPCLVLRHVLTRRFSFAVYCTFHEGRHWKGLLYSSPTGMIRFWITSWDLLYGTLVMFMQGLHSLNILVVSVAKEARRPSFGARGGVAHDLSRLRKRDEILCADDRNSDILDIQKLRVARRANGSVWTLGRGAFGQVFLESTSHARFSILHVHAWHVGIPILLTAVGIHKDANVSCLGLCPCFTCVRVPPPLSPLAFFISTPLSFYLRARIFLSCCHVVLFVDCMFVRAWRHLRLGICHGCMFGFTKCVFMAKLGSDSHLLIAAAQLFSLIK